MKRTLKLILCSILALALIAPVAVLAEEVRGVTDDTIKVGSWGPLSGPAALWGPQVRATEVLFKMVNDEGGVHGRKIDYYYRDDGYNPAKTKAIAKELVERIGIFAAVGGVGTGPGMAVRDYLMENKVIWVSPSTGSTHWTRPLQRYLFGVYPHYIDEAYLLTKYAYENIGQKISFFYQNDDYGKEGLAGAEKFMKSVGAELAATVSVEVPDTDLSSHALKLKESGADVVIMWLLPKHAAIILGETAKIGYKPQWMSTNTLSDAPIMFKVTKGMWEGVICSMFGELPNSTHPQMLKYKEATAKYAPKERWGTFYYAGFLWGEVLLEGLKRTGKDLNPETFVAAMETIDNWQGTGPPLTFTSEEHQGAKSVLLGKCDKDGNLEPVSGWLTITE